MFAFFFHGTPPTRRPRPFRTTRFPFFDGPGVGQPLTGVFFTVPPSGRPFLFFCGPFLSSGFSFCPWIFFFLEGVGVLFWFLFAKGYRFVFSV